LALSWSPDGRWLAVSRTLEYDCDDPTGPCDIDPLWIVNATDGAARRIYRTATDGEIPALDWR
jgi:hypothetical protein